MDKIIKYVLISSVAGLIFVIAWTIFDSSLATISGSIFAIIFYWSLIILDKIKELKLLLSGETRT